MPDTVPPSTTATVNPALNAAGWVDANTQVTLTATDLPYAGDVANITFRAAPTPGGIGGVTIPQSTAPGNTVSLTISTEGQTTLSYHATDRAGNVEPTHTLAISLDKTPPTNTSVSASRAPDHNGWYNQPFSARWSGTDAVSGIASCTQTTYSGPDMGSGNLQGTCTDIAGNTSAPVGLAFKYDATPPASVHGTARAPDSNGWYNHPVAVGFTGTDTTSGIDSCTTATYSGPDTTGAAVTVSCTGLAGNTAGRSFGPIKYDATGPTSSINTASTTIAVGTPITGSANDNLSGVSTTQITFSPLLGTPTTRQASCVSGCGSTVATWGVDTSGLAPGLYSVTAASSDVAANPEASPVSQTFTIL